MEKIDSSVVNRIIEILEIHLTLEIKEIKQKIKNLKRINIDSLTDQVLTRTEKDSSYNKQDIIRQIRQIIQD